MTHNLIEACRQLRLSGLAGSLDLRVQEATSHQLPHVQFLELLLQDELNVRAQRQLERRKKAAGFRDLKPLEDFDWSFNPSIKRSQIFDLATGQFIRQHRDILLLGPPGVGKSFLAQALGHAAIRAGFQVLYCSIFDLVRELQADQSPAEAQRTLTRYLKPDLLCIDDFGMKHFPPKSAEVLLELIVRRHQNRSTLLTSNRPIEEWGQLLGDVPAATAILDRFLQQAEIIPITGRSYRLRQAQPATATEETKTAQPEKRSADKSEMKRSSALLTSRGRRLGPIFTDRGSFARLDYRLLGRSLHQLGQCPGAWLRRGAEEDQHCSALSQAVWTLLAMPEAADTVLAVRPLKIERSAMECPVCKSVTQSKTCAKDHCDRVPVTVEVGWSKTNPECKAWEERAAQLGRTIIGTAEYERAVAAANALKALPGIADLRTGADLGVVAYGTLTTDTGPTLAVGEPLLAVPKEGAADDDSIYLLQAVGSPVQTVTDNALDWRGVTTRGALALDLVNAATDGVRTRVRVLLAGVGGDAEPGFCELSTAAVQAGRQAYQAGAAHYVTGVRDGVWPGHDHDGAGQIVWRIIDPL
jgi:DNA replication protein DnaC